MFTMPALDTPNVYTGGWMKSVRGRTLFPGKASKEAGDAGVEGEFASLSEHLKNDCRVRSTVWGAGPALRRSLPPARASRSWPKLALIRRISPLERGPARPMPSTGSLKTVSA